MINFLLYIWQLLQNLLGIIVISILKAEINYKEIDKKNYFYYFTDRFNFGISLGHYIIIGSKKNTVPKITLKHESGHQVQSKYWGPLYLITVGLISITRNIWDRIFHRNWSTHRRAAWYYRDGFPFGYPEKQADKLGGVNRGF